MDASCVVHEQLNFPAEGLTLEGIFSYREDLITGQKVLLLPPHPHFAGDMNNNVIRALAGDLAEAKRVLLRFNYHGVEGSEAPALGSESIFDYWRLVEEERDYGRAVKDAQSAYRFLQGLPPREVQGGFLAGYSFGALIAALAAPRMERLEGLVLISPPFVKIDPAMLEEPRCPVLVVTGEQDFVFDRAALDSALERLGNLARVETFPDKDHFFRGEEHLLAEKILPFLTGPKR